MLFASLKSRVRGEKYDTIDELAEGLKCMYDARDVGMSQVIWQSLFRRYNQALTAICV